MFEFTQDTKFVVISLKIATQTNRCWQKWDDGDFIWQINCFYMKAAYEKNRKNTPNCSLQVFLWNLVLIVSTWYYGAHNYFNWYHWYHINASHANMFFHLQTPVTKVNIMFLRIVIIWVEQFNKMVSFCMFENNLIRFFIVIFLYWYYFKEIVYCWCRRKFSVRIPTKIQCFRQ